jgi:hypothetical protein
MKTLVAARLILRADLVADLPNRGAPLGGSDDPVRTTLDILKAFDFTDYDIKIMTIEHNFVEPNRQEVFKLLSSQNFVRMLEPLSKFDGWYVKRLLLGL